MDARAFGDMLQEALDEQRISQTELARRLGVTQAAVSSWRTGAKRPNRDSAIRIEAALDVRPRGRLLELLGYSAPASDDVPLTLEDHVRADPTLSAEDRRTLLRLLRLIRGNAIADEAVLDVAADRNAARRRAARREE